LKFESCEPFGEFECMMENGMKDELCCGWFVCVNIKFLNFEVETVKLILLIIESDLWNESLKSVLIKV
jgi:hypothetical protein